MGYVEELKTIVGGENVHTGMIDRIGFSRDMSVHEGLPDVIVFAQTSDQVSRIVKIAAAQNIPVVRPWGRHQCDRSGVAGQGRHPAGSFPDESSPGTQ